MQIHELNDFYGALGSGSYLAIDNGTDTGKISKTELFADTEARIDNIIGGDAPSAAEIIDARMGANGSVYDTLGGAIRGQVRDIQNTMFHREFNIVDLIHKESVLNNGVQYTWNDDGSCTLSGTATATSFSRFFYSTTSFPPFLESGTPVALKIESTNPSSVVAFQIYKCENGALGGQWTSITSSFDGDGTYSGIIPTGLTGLMIRIYVANGTSVNETVRVSIIPQSTMLNTPNTNNYMSDDANNIKRNGIIFISTGGRAQDVANLPERTPGWLAVECIGEKSSLGVMQIFYPWNPSGHEIHWRTCQNGVWNDWKVLGSGGGGGTVIENTYNITTSPTITTDTNGWLQAVDTETESETGKTDMTGAIMSMLTDTGYCHLSPGIFYVSGSIDMPYGSTLEGCGEDTIIRLLSSVSSGYCVKPTRFSTIKGIRFSGGYSDGDVSTPTIGTRHGIAFVANKDGEESVLPNVESCTISNCWFENFSGSGIYCHNTGGGTKDGLLVSDCYFKFCKAGIDIDYYSEYHKFTNVIIYRCYYACINKGGNNVFTGCTFHGTVGFLMDGSRNNAHGSAVGCTFNHIDNWNRPDTRGGGIAVQATGTTSGFIFTGCQFWYGAISVASSKGIAFSDCLFGGNSPEITVTGKYPAFFSNCIFHATPTLDVNTSTKFDNCYLDSNGSVIGA